MITLIKNSTLKKSFALFSMFSVLFLILTNNTLMFIFTILLIIFLLFKAIKRK